MANSGLTTSFMEGLSMNKQLSVIVVVEGPTEQRFIKEVLSPYWGNRGIYIEPAVVRTKFDKHLGRLYKGGDIRFERDKIFIGNLLKERSDTIVASFFDYYGLKEWPSLGTINENHTPREIADILNQAAKVAILQDYPETLPQKRYFPFIAVHEFETLLYSNPMILAKNLHIDQKLIDDVLNDFGSPEGINKSPETAPSKRLDRWTNGQYGKTTTGISIAQDIGIETMRQQCPLFDVWLTSIEHLQK